ncbi:hypothetical protein ALC62_13209 [Cyphomyrmex costatus]|uniref:Uncharacterized protein n=1 Tax=Cyphomyrmex costatus TaxID=456900 RepID=A0A195C7N4_9HYME|nr:hypothetical protein ALC62_13209 [Cyphomyrmex costatus]
MYGDSYRRFLKPGVCPSILDGSSNNRTNVKLSENINNSWRIERDSDKNIIIKQEPEECMLLDNINETVINMENSIDLQFKRLVYTIIT